MTPSKKSITNNEVESARTQWLTERPRFEAFGTLLKQRIQKEIANAGIHAEVTSRAKEVHSLVKKLLLKPHHNYETLPDKTGVRVCVRFTREVPPVADIVDRLFACRAEKKGGIGDRVGYSSIHLDTVLRDNDLDIGLYPPAKFRAEVQVRTMAQHLWSEMDHEIYKGEIVLAPELRRRAVLLAGILELADEEFNRISEAAMKMPDATDLRILHALERQYFKLSSQRGSVELSLAVIRALAPLYSPPPADWDAYFEALFAQSANSFRALYGSEDPDASAFLHQPEALLIYDRLRRDIYGIKHVWSEHFPPEELQRFAEKFGEWV